MRLAAVLDLDLEVRVLRRESLERPFSAGAPSPVRIVSTPRGSASSRSTTAARDLLEVVAAGDRLALEQAEERALRDGEAVQLRRRARRS